MDLSPQFIEPTEITPTRIEEIKIVSSMSDQEVFNQCGTCADCLKMLELGYVVDLNA